MMIRGIYNIVWGPRAGIMFLLNSLDALRYPLGHHLDLKFGAFLEPSCVQVGPKIDEKSIWKDDEIFEGILEASWWHLEASWEIFWAT